MRKITKDNLRATLYMKYKLNVSTKQITLTKSYCHSSLMIVDGIGGMGIFRYGFDTMGNIQIYPNKMHEINLNL